MKRWLMIFLIIIIASNLTGCDALQRKFTRKKSNVTKRPRFYQLKKYTKKPSPELYKQHFAYWQSWQTELIQFLGNNHKKDVRAIEEANGHLKDMQSILIPSKAEEMQPHVDRMENAKDIIYRGPLSFANKDSVKNTLEREERAIKRDFCYSKVRDSLRKTSGEEEVPHLTMAVGGAEPVEPSK